MITTMYGYVWLYSGDVSYFKDGKHISLGVFSILVLLFLFFPYTLLMHVGHKLIAHSNRPFLSWVKKVMLFLDSYILCFIQERILLATGLDFCYSFNVPCFIIVCMLLISLVALASI